MRLQSFDQDFHSPPLTFAEFPATPQSPLSASPSPPPAVTSTTLKSGISSSIKTSEVVSSATVISTPDDFEEGSGEQKGFVLDQETCRTLYNSWNDPDFSGGKPPPLDPDEKLSEEICDHILFVAKRSCTTGNKRVKVNAALCEYINAYDSSLMKSRKQHASYYDQPSDDEEIIYIQGDESEPVAEVTEDISGLTFKQGFTAESKPYHVEIELNAQSAYGSHSAMLLPDTLMMLVVIISYSELICLLNVFEEFISILVFMSEKESSLQLFSDT